MHASADVARVACPGDLDAHRAPPRSGSDVLTPEVLAGSRLLPAPSTVRPLGRCDDHNVGRADRSKSVEPGVAWPSVAWEPMGSGIKSWAPRLLPPEGIAVTIRPAVRAPARLRAAGPEGPRWRAARWTGQSRRRGAAESDLGEEPVAAESLVLPEDLVDHLLRAAGEERTVGPAQASKVSRGRRSPRAAGMLSPMQRE